MDILVKTFLMVYVLLNPFIMSVYMMDILRTLELRRLVGQLTRAGIISLMIFLAFAWLGERIFEKFLQVRFTSFLLFGGVVYLLIGIRLILGLSPPVDISKSDPETISAVICMPFIIGPGTISASVLAGVRMPLLLAAVTIGLSLAAALASIVLIKILHDWVRTRHEQYVQLYSELVGRATALFTGSFAVDMIITTVERWLSTLT